MQNWIMETDLSDDGMTLSTLNLLVLRFYALQTGMVRNDFLNYGITLNEKNEPVIGTKNLTRKHNLICAI